VKLLASQRSESKNSTVQSFGVIVLWVYGQLTMASKPTTTRYDHSRILQWSHINGVCFGNEEFPCTDNCTWPLQHGDDSAELHSGNVWRWRGNFRCFPSGWGTGDIFPIIWRLSGYSSFSFQSSSVTHQIRHPRITTVIRRHKVMVPHFPFSSFEECVLGYRGKQKSNYGSVKKGLSGHVTKQGTGRLYDSALEEVS